MAYVGNALLKLSGLRCTPGFVWVNRLSATPPLPRRRMHTTSERGDVADIVISGGGMVGAAMACALAYESAFSDKKIILLEAAPMKDYNLLENYSNRVCALNPSTVGLLSSFGAWEEILKKRCHAVKRMQVWDACSNSLISFSNNELSDDLAYIVENEVIQAAIMKRLELMKNNIEVRYSSRANSYKIPTDSSEVQNPWITVHLQDGQLLWTRLLIGADGAYSLVRQIAGVHTLKRDYHQSAVVATLHLSETENSVAWQRFLPTGPIALLPLSDTRSSLVWTTTNENAKNLLQIPEESFVDAVNDAFWNDDKKNAVAVIIGEMFENVLQTVTSVSLSVRQLPPTVIGVTKNSRARFPLGLTHASHYVKPRVVLIGDAAHRIHPLAGQGVNLGFGDVISLRDQLTKAVHDGCDVGSLTALLSYETERQRRVLLVAATIDGLQRLYGTAATPIVVLRSIGLQATNAMTFLKKRIIQGASS